MWGPKILSGVRSAGAMTMASRAATPSKHESHYANEHEGHIGTQTARFDALLCCTKARLCEWRDRCAIRAAIATSISDVRAAPHQDNKHPRQAEHKQINYLREYLLEFCTGSPRSTLSASFAWGKARVFSTDSSSLRPSQKKKRQKESQPEFEEYRASFVSYAAHIYVQNAIAHAMQGT